MNVSENKFQSSIFYTLPKCLKNYEKIYIYGAGNYGKFTLTYLNDNDLGKKFDSFIVSKLTRKFNKISDRDVKLIDEVNISDNDVVLIAARSTLRIEMIEKCRSLNIKNFFEIDFFDDGYFFKDITPEEYPLMLSYWYKMRTGEDVDLENPKKFNDKLQWLKLYDRDPLKTLLTDKYLVRDYIKEKIGEKYLIPLLGVWDNFDEINFDELPDRFVLKCNHGSAMNVIVKDKSKLDIAKAKANFDRWLKINYAYNGLQLQYLDIKPKIIAEEYIENLPGDLWDYKFWCFGGKVESIMFLSNRGKGLCKNNYDRNWKKMDFSSSDYPSSDLKVDKPDNLDEMIDLSEQLSKGFAYVRIDLYRLNDGTIKFGEFTFTPFNGLYTWHPESMNDYFGELIKLPIDK
ncbi:MAG: hypothetical protein IJ728_08205 [Selenomonadaceae bacterium]|nr:hypothetical protein [Selenomonadaceae bacterium]